MAVATPFSCGGGNVSTLRTIQIEARSKWKKRETYLSDLLTQHSSPDDHPLTMRSFPKSAREYTDVEFLHRSPYAEIFDPLPEEVLIAKEWLYNRGDPGSQTGTRRSSATVVGRCVNLPEEPIVGRRFDLENLWWKWYFRNGGLFVAESVGPALGKDATYIRF